MSYETILVDIDDRGVARLTLNRPEIFNAMNDQLTREVLAAARALDADDAVRAVVLTGAGESFCAGADLNWMKSVLHLSRAERVAGSAEVADLLMGLNDISKPLIGRINGPAYGGGVGLTSVCDITIGVTTCKFVLSEVKLGLLPANISPYVVARMGVRASRRCFLNAHPIDAAEAREYGLLDKVVEPDELDEAVEREIRDLLKCAPGAVAATKRLIAHVAYRDFRDSAVYTADRLADAWETEEGQEGIAAFLEKRKAAWVP
jgi:methylglutaconyl-CoA hydratase